MFPVIVSGPLTLTSRPAAPVPCALSLLVHSHFLWLSAAPVPCALSQVLVRCTTSPSPASSREEKTPRRGRERITVRSVLSLWPWSPSEEVPYGGQNLGDLPGGELVQVLATAAQPSPWSTSRSSSSPRPSIPFELPDPSSWRLLEARSSSRSSCGLLWLSLPHPKTDSCDSYGDRQRRDLGLRPVVPWIFSFSVFGFSSPCVLVRSFVCGACALWLVASSKCQCGLARRLPRGGHILTTSSRSTFTDVPLTCPV